MGVWSVLKGIDQRVRPCGVRLGQSIKDVVLLGKLLISLRLNIDWKGGDSVLLEMLFTIWGTDFFLHILQGIFRRIWMELCVVWGSLVTNRGWLFLRLGLWYEFKLRIMFKSGDFDLTTDWWLKLLNCGTCLELNILPQKSVSSTFTPYYAAVNMYQLLDR